jgi:hypothetical protein
LEIYVDGNFNRNRIGGRLVNSKGFLKDRYIDSGRLKRIFYGLWEYLGGDPKERYWFWEKK